MVTVLLQIGIRQMEDTAVSSFSHEQRINLGPSFLLSTTTSCHHVRTTTKHISSPLLGLNVLLSLYPKNSVHNAVDFGLI